MRWLVEITDITDKRLLSDLLAKGKVRLSPEENRFYLISDDFESLSICSKVWEKANEIRSIISEISSGLDAGVSFKLGTVYEQKEDGSRHGTVFRSGVAPVLKLFADGGSWAVTPEISEEEKLRLEAERLERKYQEKLALVSSRVLPALRNDRALKVHRFLQQDLTGARMYHIYELIRDDLGKHLNSLAFNKDWARFTHSVNHQEVFGDDARHIASKKEPPTNPMSPSEAQVFILRVTDLWFKRKCVDDNV